MEVVEFSEQVHLPEKHVEFEHPHAPTHTMAANREFQMELLLRRRTHEKKNRHPLGKILYNT